MSDFFQKLAEDHVPEEPEALELPPNKWCLAVNTTEENGGAAPKVRSFEKKDGDMAYSFSTGVIIVGGEKAISEKFAGRFCFGDRFILPYKDPETGEVKGSSYVSGQLAGMMNACLSCGIGNDLDKDERRQARWNNTVDALQQVSKEERIKLEDYADLPDLDEDGKKGVFLAQLFVAALKKKQYLFLFKTKQDEWRVKNDKEDTIVIGAIEEATPENIKKRKVRAFEEAAGVELDEPTAF